MLLFVPDYMRIPPVCHLVDNIIRHERFFRQFSPVLKIIPDRMADILAHIRLKCKLAVKHVVLAIYFDYGTGSAADASFERVFKMQLVLCSNIAPAKTKENSLNAPSS